MSTVRLNNRGQPCTSVGQRNAGALGSGFGNGGVTPPVYERRRDATGNGRHPRSFRDHWRRVLSHLLDDGQIDPVTFAVGYALTEFSNDRAESVWPAQATIGKRIGRSASTVCRRLARLRELEVLEWDHRFEGDTNDRKGVRGTSNFYEFRIPDELGTAAGLPTYRRRQRPTRDQRHPGPSGRVTAPSAGSERRTPRLDDWRPQVDSTVAAVVRAASSYRAAEAEIESLYGDHGVEHRTYAQNTLNELWATLRAPPPRRSDE